MKSKQVKVALPPPKLAIIIAGEREAITEDLVVKYHLQGNTRAPFTGHAIVQVE